MKKNYMRWLAIAGGVLGVCLILVIAGGYGAYVKWRDSDRIVPQYYIQGEDVGGLTTEIARQRLEDRFGRLFVALNAPERDIRLSLSQLGGKLEYDYAVDQAHRYGRRGNVLKNMWQFWFATAGEKRDVLPLRWNEDELRKTMWTVAYTYNQQPQNATLQVNGGTVEVISEQSGRRMDVPASIDQIKRKYFPGLSAVTVTATTTEPEILSAQLQGQDVMLGEYSTKFNPGIRGRTANVHLAAQAVAGKVLMPGDEFSFNRTTGERTTTRGYQVAKVFVKLPNEEKSQIVDGVGGGVCQVSSTLYNAVRRTNDEKGGNLAITERNHHSLPVNYVPAGRDATVAWPYKDFRFRNRYKFPIYLKTSVSGPTLTISVWGRVPDGDVAQLSAAAISTEQTG